MRLPIFLYSLYALVHDVISFSGQVAQEPAMWAHADAGVIIATLARVSQWMFVALLAVLPLFRHRPIAKSTAVLPRFAALVTVCIPPFCVLLERAPPNLWCNLMAVLAGVSASILGVLTLSFLGRSFSVMPEARRLVTTGPYSIVRHPLYLFELLGVVGILLQVRSLPGLMLLALIVALQIARALERSRPGSRHSGVCGLPPTSPVLDPAQCAQPFRAAARRPDGAPPFGHGHELGFRPACSGRNRAAAARWLEDIKSCSVRCGSCWPIWSF
jgi:protein-S-isoprenylcysteine O-methyltransferase Ste14